MPAVPRRVGKPRYHLVFGPSPRRPGPTISTVALRSGRIVGDATPGSVPSGVAPLGRPGLDDPRGHVVGHSPEPCRSLPVRLGAGVGHDAGPRVGPPARPGAGAAAQL